MPHEHLHLFRIHAMLDEPRGEEMAQCVLPASVLRIALGINDACPLLRRFESSRDVSGVPIDSRGIREQELVIVEGAILGNSGTMLPCSMSLDSTSNTGGNTGTLR